ncbi:GNAT family N-acetyltransferase [Staphylococcus argenteus]|uniref:GNAT family N-acetyltransferase n=1 Tax=Staphylococcus argenteus TaxID=985002 RepID=UPI0004FF6A4C|nr:GNAT family N-acetyltransferase [Staphylococcus argenteus]MBE2134540.1 GNAT family N-acetyltransferase [Staphylococcus argenteus]MBE2146842.1 GNAT family N-acetyltransferase [Staphylococcus argenteus]MBE2160458.1 GNAT family N-acetyltransferase [Staphylococcus argenteus]MCG9797623.1 GNAT family N-acetyltransferase [Staphylococcus argenteus]MCG9799740.1 GNAT family N-acetyltransferase [Staphylococcus argenteus]
MDIVQLYDITQIKSFIEHSNYESASYLYKLPQQYKEIDVLIADAIESPGVFALQENDSIKAIILSFTYDKDKFKVIGPFIADNYVLSTDTFESLFAAMTSKQPEDAIFNFSFEEGIQQYKHLMKSIQASYNFTDYYIEARKSLEDDMHQPNIIPYHKGFYRAFSKLHTNTFKYQAQHPQEIVDSLDETHHLFLFVSEGLLKGYLYLEIDTQQSIAEIKYFSSHVDYRLKGIAFELLAYALQYAFDNYDIRKVYFKIRNKNNKLIERFNGLGFHINYEYIKFKFESRNVKNQSIPE